MEEEACKEGVGGAVEVFIHEARDIQNICIYHKQDVYAKLCLTGQPDSAAVSTKIINGGGRNPVFNESARLSVRDAGSSLRCEIWMLSRAKNYLQDQLLGFALIPLSQTPAPKDFPLTSNDLFHSPAGFVHLSVSLIGSWPMPEVPPPPPPPPPPAISFAQVEFPDLKLAGENQMMVSEYVGAPCASSEGFPDEAAGVKIVQSFSSENPPPPPPLMESDHHHKLLQQEIVDLYMKSMQQFTDSLANMKLPMDIDAAGTSAGKNSASAGRVFYGSRAFF